MKVLRMLTHWELSVLGNSLVGIVGMGGQLDLMILEVSSDLNDSMILQIGEDREMETWESSVSNGGT